MWDLRSLTRDGPVPLHWEHSLNHWTRTVPAGAVSMENAFAIVLKLQIALGSMDILTTRILPIHECGISFHLCVFSFNVNKNYLKVEKKEKAILLESSWGIILGHARSLLT